MPVASVGIYFPWTAIWVSQGWAFTLENWRFVSKSSILFPSLAFYSQGWRFTSQTGSVLCPGLVFVPMSFALFPGLSLCPQEWLNAAKIGILFAGLALCSQVYLLEMNSCPALGRHGKLLERLISRVGRLGLFFCFPFVKLFAYL